MPEPSVPDALDALLAFLPTMEETRDIAIVSAWVDDTDRICLVYRDPGRPQTVGLRKAVHLDEVVETLDEWVQEVALYEIGEPLGSIAYNMLADDDGVYWWGEVPVPGRAGRWTPMLEPPPDQVS